jgi:hypothetical protein
VRPLNCDQTVLKFSPDCIRNSITGVYDHEEKSFPIPVVAADA